MSPLVPDAADDAPVANKTFPEAADAAPLDAPVDIEKSPEPFAAAPNADALLSVTAPLTPVADEPLVTVTEPPVAAANAVFPAVIVIPEPDPLALEPTAILILPA